MELIQKNINNKLKFVIPVNLYKDNKYNKLRRSVLILIADLLYKYKDINNLSYLDIQQKVINIELSCYEETINKSNEYLYIKSWSNPKFEHLYRLYTNKITKNLDIESEVGCSYLIDLIINNKIDIKKIASMSSFELCPIKSKDIRKKIHDRNNSKLEYKISNNYTCSNCKKKSVIMTEVQIRRIDEASSLSLTCTFCQKNWII